MQDLYSTDPTPGYLYVLDHADCTASNGQHELLIGHTDQEYICPAWQILAVKEESIICSRYKIVGGVGCLVWTNMSTSYIGGEKKGGFGCWMGQIFFRLGGACDEASARVYHIRAGTWTTL